MNVLGHHDVTVDAKPEAAAHALKRVLKDSSAFVRREQWAAVIATKCYEVALPSVVIALETRRHQLSVACCRAPLKQLSGVAGSLGFKVKQIAAFVESPTQAEPGLEWATGGLSVQTRACKTYE